MAEVLALSGSLRKASLNSALLRAAARLAPPPLIVSVFDRIGELPLFNPDFETRPAPSLTAFYRRVAAADALLIASPEYAHGVTGTLKNALDWLVGFEAFVAMPVVVLNASPRAHRADAALRKILRTMSAFIVETASVTLPLQGTGFDEDRMLNSAEIAVPLQAALSALRDTLARGVTTY